MAYFDNDLLTNLADIFKNKVIKLRKNEPTPKWTMDNPIGAQIRIRTVFGLRREKGNRVSCRSTIIFLGVPSVFITLPLFGGDI